MTEINNDQQNQSVVNGQAVAQPNVPQQVAQSKVAQFTAATQTPLTAAAPVSSQPQVDAAARYPQDAQAQPQPEVVNRLTHNEHYTYTDKNGYKWNYTFQFPGIRKAYEILDNAKNENGTASQSKLFDQYCQTIIVDPAHLTLDDFDRRPGFGEVMAAADSFFGKWLD